MSDSCCVLTDPSHAETGVGCSSLLRQFMFTEARPACNQSRQASISCGLVSLCKSPLLLPPLWPWSELSLRIQGCYRQFSYSKGKSEERLLTPVLYEIDQVFNSLTLKQRNTHSFVYSRHCIYWCITINKKETFSEPMDLAG